MPVSQADSVTRRVPQRSRLAASSAVRIPSSPRDSPALAPASARPERSSGFSAGARALLGLEEAVRRDVEHPRRVETFQLLFICGRAQANSGIRQRRKNSLRLTGSAGEPGERGDGLRASATERGVGKDGGGTRRRTRR